MKVVSLFAGAGGLDLGFVMAGHEIVWANDSDPDAVRTYRRNIGNHIVCADIRSIDPASIPAHNILIGGFPCQGFSVANTKRGYHDKRNALYLELLRILLAKKPEFFLAENVKGILSRRHGDIFGMILSDFMAADYRVKYELLNAADFGVPQKRERVIIVGVRNNIGIELEFPEPTHSSEPCLFGYKRPWVSIGEALEHIPEPAENHDLTNHNYSKFKLKFNGYIGNRAIDPTQPAPTVTARGDDRGGVVVLHHPKNHRRMSARELALTQSFPVDYTFEGSNSSVYRQIGNAVPPLLSFALASMFPNSMSQNDSHNTAAKTIPKL